MQKLFSLLVLIALVLPAQAQILKCNIQDAAVHGSTITLSALRGNLETEVATTTVDNNGHFQFSRQGLEEGYYKLALSQNQSVELILADAEPVIDITFTSSDLGNSAYINQSTENFAAINWALTYKNISTRINELKQLQRNTPKDDTDQQNYIAASIDSFWVFEQQQLANMLSTYPNTFFSRVNKAYSNSAYKDYLSRSQIASNGRDADQLSKDYFNSVDFNDESLIRSPVLKNMVWRYMNNYIPRNNSVAILEPSTALWTKLQSMKMSRTFAWSFYWMA